MEVWYFVLLILGLFSFCIWIYSLLKSKRKAGIISQLFFSFLFGHWITVMGMPGIFGLILLSIVSVLLYYVFYWVLANFLNHVANTFFYLVTYYLVFWVIIPYPYFWPSHFLTPFLLLNELLVLLGSQFFDLLFLMCPILYLTLNKRILIFSMLGLVAISAFSSCLKREYYYAEIKVKLVSNQDYRSFFSQSNLDSIKKLHQRDTFDLVAFPETFSLAPIKGSPNHLNGDFKALQKSVSSKVFLIGAVLTEESTSKDPLFYNTAIIFSTEEDTFEVAYKRHYVPFYEKDFLGLKSLGGFASDAGDKSDDSNLRLFDGEVQICYDSSFPTANSHCSSCPILVLSNEEDFRDSYGQFLFNFHSQTRALESGKTVIKVANQGCNAIFYPNGEIIKGFEEGVVKLMSRS